MTAEEAAEVIHKRLLPSADELDRSKNNPLDDLETPYQREYGAEGPPQSGVVLNVKTFNTDLLGEKDMTFKQLVTDAEKVASAILGVAPAILGFLLPNSKVTPIVTAIAPLIPQAMAAANTFIGTDGAGTDKAAAASALLQFAVSTGKVVSTGGQAHTMDEFQAALPEIQKLFTGVINSLDAVANTVSQAPAA